MAIQNSRILLAEKEFDIESSSYPVDMSAFLVLPQCAFDAAAVPYQVKPAGYHPTTIAQYALAHWNQYLTTAHAKHRGAFLAQANWLVEHEVHIGNSASGWPISFPHPEFSTRSSWLSAPAQGCGISVLVRAYQLTQEKAFLEAASRAIRTFEQDILDGGISTPVGKDGIFFEEVAVYPAAHVLSGFIFALFGLYDYVALTGDIQVKKLMQRSLAALHSLLDEFDVGYWTRSDLLHRRLASFPDLTLQVTLLEALARYSGCQHCALLASGWRKYQLQFGSRLRYQITSRCVSYGRAVWHRVQTALLARSGQGACKRCPSHEMRVCVSVPAFPVMGGILTVLEGIAQVTKNLWQIEYLAQHIGSGQERYIVHRFGTRRMTPWYFPFIWLYVLSGVRKLIALMHHGAGYQVLLPQDGVFTGALAALAGRLTGVRVVCIDHGDLSLFTSRNSRLYRAERIDAVATKNWPPVVRLAAQWLLMLYWPSRYLLARFAARFVDHFLIPGVASDSVEEGCKRIGIDTSRITRFGSMIDINRHVVLDAASRATTRRKKGIDADAIVIAIVCRLSPEKGIDIALESISQVLSACSPDLSARVRIIIAGDGPIREQIEQDIRQRGLSQTCLPWGDISANEVITLLGISDIFLYTSMRGACIPMSVLEAMASGCAVIASTEPLANAVLLAEGRGIAVPPGDVEQTSKALLRLLSDLDLCGRMGKLARDYIAEHHSPTMFRRTLQRVTYWSALDDLLDAEKNGKTVGIESGN